MTTAVVVKANHGWPVLVTRIEGHFYTSSVVEAGAEATFHVWDGSDLRIHEIQPDEQIAGDVASPRTL